VIAAWGRAALFGLVATTTALAQAPPPDPKPPANVPTEEEVGEAADEAGPAKNRPPPKALAPPAGTIGERPATSGVVLQTLDKVTARIGTLDVALDHDVRLGSLVIRPRACVMNPPEAAPESAAFLEIDDSRNAASRVFAGWMFASSPALSALQHPVYDVWVKTCKIAAGSSTAPAAPKR